MVVELKRICPFTNTVNSLTIDMTESEFNKKFFRWKALELDISDAFPELTEYERDFMLYGTTKAQSNAILSKEESSGKSKQCVGRP